MTASKTDKPFRFQSLPTEIQIKIIEWYFADKTIRVGAMATSDIVHVFSDFGLLLTNHDMHDLAKKVIREVKCDTVVLSHYNMFGFRNKACVDIMLDFVPAVKVAIQDVRVIKYDYGPRLRHNVVQKKFPNVTKLIAVMPDGHEHVVVRDRESWKAVDL